MLRPSAPSASGGVLAKKFLPILGDAMAFQPVPDVAQIDHIFTLNGITVENVYYARRPGGYTLADLQALADIIDLVFPSTYSNDMPLEVTYVRTEVRGLAFENDQVATQALSTGSGTITGGIAPNQVSFAIKKGSGQTGRAARGRTYWIGIPRAQIDGSDENFITAAYAASIVADVNFIRNQIGTVGLWEAVLVSRWLNGVKRVTGVTFPWVSVSNIDLRVDTLRGRLPNV